MVTRVLATVAVALTTAATAHAQHWQRITSDLHMTKTAAADGTSLTIVHKSGDVVTIEIDYATRAIRVTRNFETRSVDNPESMAQVAQMLASSAAAHPDAGRMLGAVLDIRHQYRERLCRLSSAARLVGVHGGLVVRHRICGSRRSGLGVVLGVQRFFGATSEGGKKLICCCVYCLR